MTAEIKKKNENEVLLLSRKPDIYSTQRLVQALTKSKLAYRVEDPETNAIGTPQVIIPRLGTWRFFEALERLKPLSPKFKFLNAPQPYLQSRNKWTCLQTLAGNSIQTPLSQLVHRDEFEFLEISFPFVLKELFSSQGQGVFLIRSLKDLTTALKQNLTTEDYLVQNYIQECHGEDLRLFVTTTGDHWSMKRKNTHGDFRSNLSTGGQAFADIPSSEELEIAFKTLNIFHLDYAGIDILRSNDGPLVIEVNPCPGFQGLESLHGPVIAESLVRLLI